MFGRPRTATRPGQAGARRLSVLFMLAAAAGCGPPPGAGMTALTGATVIDVISGRVEPDAVVLIRGHQIVAVGSSDAVEIPRGTERIALPGRWIIPGLIDAHVHLQPWGMRLALQYGVTAVRDLHDGESLADSLRAASLQAARPHRFAAVAMLDVPPTTYPDAVALVSPDSAAAAIDTLVADGATWVKVYTHVTPDLLAAVVAAARTHQLPVAAHLGLTDALTAGQLGVASIEHLSGIPEAAGDSVPLFAAHRLGFFAGWTAFEESWAALDTLVLANVARTLAVQRVVLVPTLVLHETFAHLDDPHALLAADLASVPDSARQNWDVPGMIKRAGWQATDFTAFRSARPVQDWFVRTFVAAGGRIATGTDAANQLLVPGAALHREMELLVAAGLPPLTALRAATVWGADLLRADSLGRLRPGAPADLVVLTADPLADIRNTRKIERVMLGGEWVKKQPGAWFLLTAPPRVDPEPPSQVKNQSRR